MHVSLDVADPDTSTLFAVTASTSLAVATYHAGKYPGICPDLITVTASTPFAVPASDNPNILACPVWRNHELSLPDLSAVAAPASRAVPARDNEEVGKCLQDYDRVLRYRC